MADYGIKVLKPNAPSQYDVFNAPPRYLTILSTAESLQVYMSGKQTNGGYVYHNLNYIPICEVYYEEADGGLRMRKPSIYPDKLYVSSNCYYVIYLQGAI